ncbi:MAG: hypothetical protein JNJ39_17735 [Blastocatellia bacterium]|nr:hypothetical protein [Blastocatellia bacterium]
MEPKNIRLIGILAFAGVLLSVPYFAMKFTNEVNWTMLDFVVMGVLLLVTGLACEFALRTFKVTWAKVAVVAGILFGFVMVWAALVHMGG